MGSAKARSRGGTQGTQVVFRVTRIAKVRGRGRAKRRRGGGAQKGVGGGVGGAPLRAHRAQQQLGRQQVAAALHATTRLVGVGGGDFVLLDWARRGVIRVLTSRRTSDVRRVSSASHTHECNAQPRFARITLLTLLTLITLITLITSPGRARPEPMSGNTWKP